MATTEHTINDALAVLLRKLAAEPSMRGTKKK